MLTLKELFDDLAHGEFAHMAIGNARVGTIQPDRYPKLVSLINAGLLDLYTRFSLKTKEINLHQRAGKTLYYLRSEHAGDPNGGDDEIYLDATIGEGISNDIIKITKAYNDMGERVHINDARYPEDIFMPEQDIIKMTPSDPVSVISLVYQASYPRITITEGFDPATEKLYFPRYLKRALMAFVAASLFTGKTSNSVEGQGSVTRSFLYRYEAECLRIEGNTLDLEVEEEPEQFSNNGWA